MINKIRLWILKKLFTDDEKYLIVLAIDSRINILEKISVTERWADKENILNDVIDLNKIRPVFSSSEMC